MKLSVCMIARNEAANLARSLPSVRDIADELIVIDTGSTDDTVQVAQSFGAIVAHFAWCDDFSAARNVALDRATGDWIFWLDADEALMPDSRDALQQAITATDVEAYLVVRRDLADAHDASRYTQMWQLRLFRNRADRRFQGRCHPAFHPTPEPLQSSTIALEHWGYLGDLTQQKLQRARKLLELELRDRPGQLYYLVELFRTQKQLGETDAAMTTLQQTMRIAGRHVNDAHPPTMAALLLETLLQLPAENLIEPWSPGLVRRCAERWFPDAPPLNWLMAQQDFAAGRYEPAAKKLKQLVKMGRTQRYDRMCNFDPRIIDEDAMLNLGVCLTRLGELREAEQVFTQLRQHPAKRAQAETNLAVVKRLRQQFKV